MPRANFLHIWTTKLKLKLQTELIFFSLSSRDLGGNWGGFLFHFSLFFLAPENYRVCVFFLHLIDCGFFKSFLNLIGVDRFFVLIFRFVLQFFLWFFSGFFLFHHFFSFFPFLRLSHLLWSFECVGIFCFQYCFSFTFNFPLFFSSFFSFVLFQFLCQRR